MGTNGKVPGTSLYDGRRRPGSGTGEAGGDKEERLRTVGGTRLEVGPLEVRGRRFEGEGVRMEIRQGRVLSSNPASSLSPQTSGCRMPAERYVFPFEKLDVWQESLALTEYILGLLEQLPQNRHIRLLSQMEGAATSVPQNIAEGKGRQYRKEFLQYLSIAQGSLYETVTLNEVFRRHKLFDDVGYFEIRSRAVQIDRKLNGLMNSVRGKKRVESVRG